ncbi:MAG TPA: hypothetical protein VK567_20195, partial [Bradyrhizobium sp.]|nr:hypothetical protein [Bradyrhizobium sp.]
MRRFAIGIIVWPRCRATRSCSSRTACPTDQTKPRMYKLYSMQRSGNSYKVRLALALLNAPYRA